ncbi:MAG TPA: hypothetical protein VK629_12285 [Steroidobacteraceae bacterium]|nr:hypothetical protein [Steroidobacteraceae bacterium]
MNNSQEYDLHVLNELIVMALRSADVYEEAAPATDMLQAPLFKQCAVARMELASQLQDQVLAFEGRPAGSQSIVAAASAAAEQPHASAAFNIDIGYDEHAFLDRFDAALNDLRVSDPIRSSIGDAYVRAHGECMSGLLIEREIERQSDWSRETRSDAVAS